MDWDVLMKNAARGRDFTGRSAADEQAYFEAFADDAEPVVRLGNIGSIRYLVLTVIGFLSSGFMLR